MSNDLTLLIETYNEYEGRANKMYICEIGEYYELYIDSQLITEGDEYDIVKRVKQINRERGYAY